MNWGWDEPAPPLFSSNIYRRTLFVSTGSVLRGEESISRSNISNVSILEAMPLTTTFLWTRQVKRRGGVSVICPSSYILQTTAFVFTISLHWFLLDLHRVAKDWQVQKNSQASHKGFKVPIQRPFTPQKSFTVNIKLHSKIFKENSPAK